MLVVGDKFVFMISSKDYRVIDSLRIVRYDL